ncbi:MG2 domain-containing protein [Hymenobacter sp. ASUV-10]|uniref:MG2 domain-containing protein n=1 Tax=Hymenobacter aranciens TaxID=3063996 RepID=A0ABT9B8D4_9BACT|nr:MG2 domain-containing protein [Hymenobacter sp. ASUV-10]MDO7874537.1 MG2 domain-containing protein [Hymenobacter sp. ASUV-10]
MRYILFALLLVLMTFSNDSAAPAPPPGPFGPRWKKIDTLLAKDQTATAAPLVEALYQDAKKQNNAPAYVRALLYKIRLLQRKEEDADEKAISLLEKDLQTANFPARPILHSLLAELYTNYLNQNRYRLYQRTAGTKPRPDDGNTTADGGTGLATWDLGRLGATIVRHYYQSVEDEPQRQLKTTLAELGDLATGGDAEGRALRPSLYDLLAHRAIQGLQNQELYVTRPEQQFLLTEPKVFGTAAEFAALRLLAPEVDSLNGQLHTLHLLQRLTASRQQLAPQNVAALADVDLQRLDYLHGITPGTDLAELYVPALVRMAETYKTLPISTEFTARRVQALHEAGENVAAVALAKEAEKAYPKSRGAQRARSIREEIERPELDFSAADIVTPGQPWRLDATALNLSSLHAWAYRITMQEWEAFGRYDSRQRTFAERYARALKNKPVANWAVPVPAHPLDYKTQKISAAGTALPAGYYLVVLSNQADKPLEQRPGAATSYAVLGASELSAVHRREADTGAPQLLVLHRQSGAPLAGVSARASYQYYDRKKQDYVSRPSDILKTNPGGEVQLPAPASTNDNREQLQAVRIWRGTDTLLVAGVNGYYYPGRPGLEPTQRRTFMFTDRAIYRPGQTLYFKGVLAQHVNEKSTLLTGQPVSVRLQDVNGQTVQTLTFTTSEFGSFHGSLVLPTSLLNGEMSLQTDDGSVSFAVEDYKRPTFAVTFEPVTGTPALGQPLTLRGQAKAYAGQATDGATVSYRVTRRELMLYFGYGGRFVPGGGGAGSQEIAHGTTQTDAEGRFTITFTPPVVPKTGKRRWESTYIFEITADVTDAAGETRTGTQSLTIGKDLISLRLEGPDKADKQALEAFKLFSTNATGEPTPATGTLRLLERSYRPLPPGVPGPVPENEENEARPRLVQELPFDTKNGPALPNLQAALAGLPTGRYQLKARVAGQDSAQAQLDFVLYDSKASQIPYATPDWVLVPADSVRPGQPATLLLGSSETDARVLLEVERGGQLLQKEWLTLTAGQQQRLEVASGPATARGPLYIHTTQVRDNHLYHHTATVQVAEPPQPLKLSINTFRDKLQPGQKETWRVTIHQADGKPADAELLATLYDQSLDVFRQHGLMGLDFGGSYYPSRFEWAGNFGELDGQSLFSPPYSGVSELEYPMLNNWLGGGNIIHGKLLSRSKRSLGYSNAVVVQDSNADMAMMAAPAPAMAAAPSGMALKEVAIAGNATPPPPPPAPPKADLSGIVARSDFRETALWQPALRTDKNGDVVLEFQMPEAVTRWQLLTLAHDKNLRTGRLARQLVTQKQIQITPNAPRFFRQGDSFTFQAKFSNLTDAAVSGTAQLFLLDAATGQDITSQLLKGNAQQAVAANGQQSAAVSWEIALPGDFAPAAVTYRVVAQTDGGTSADPKGTKKEQRRAKKHLGAPNKDLEGAKTTLGGPTSDLKAPITTLTGAKTTLGGSYSDLGGTNTTFTDGEENTLPVLPNRILVTESLPLPIVGPATRDFDLTKLSSTSSPTRRNQSLTLEMTSNPAWYAVQSLPYLMEYPYECSEQVFSRLYANLLAAQILKSNPRFKTVLVEWNRQAQNGTAAQKNALESKLAQNQELKNLLLQETPWVRDAQGETERLARLSTLFDEVRLRAETTAALAKLQRMQLGSGAFPWFEKMPDDRYITQLIVAGFGKLKKLGAFDAEQDDVARNILQDAQRYLDNALARDYAELRKIKGIKLAEQHIGDLHIQALYARSFWTAPIPASAKPAYDYYRGQAATYWPAQTRYLQAQTALLLFRANANQRSASAKAPAAQDILRALSENALHSPELGMYWKEVRGGYYWREAPTETQATLIEAFHEVKADQKSVDEMKLWLLKQKQTHSWESTRATADACYALLLRGSDWLTPSQPLQITVGGETVRPEAAQAGTGYFKTTWAAAEIKPAQGKVRVQKTDAGVAWGALYWQYFEDLDKITPAATPLSLTRELYRETRTAAGPQLEKLTATSPLKVGDALVVRLVLRTDRELEYVHLKDQRAAGLEPIAQTSGYRYQNGLGYYESPRDAATNFFLSAVPRGTHVFEYRLRASQAGDFSGGLSQVQCLYAPEFGSHSAGGRLTIGR